MKMALIALFALAVVLGAGLFILGAISRSGKAPGLLEGRLAPCPKAPNCVCSEEKGDAGHYIEPVAIPPHVEGMGMIRETILEMGGRIRDEEGGHLAATFSSRFFGFVDDFEIRADFLEKKVHIRSASRVGHSDFGANRRRAERFSVLCMEKMSRKDAEKDGEAPKP
ncbi:conserved hypothetical protein [Candidatus Desulfarcum epimagneticum]|uniref:DUF1499 domain-containing protein n=1 Tax=uncultured Desulfobacteraceae bacterium TaxID=218296 RepID=A0A484HJQ0_9BACT|nr:conserved hypothetical protein [uncultured Desulfobacteraceae bacterium]